MSQNEIATGWKICINKVKHLLDDAQLLLSNDRLAHALGLYTFAVEEYGKGLLLKDCMFEDRDRCTVPKYIFGHGGRQSHEKKFQRAMQELPACARNIALTMTVNTPSGNLRTIRFSSGSLTLGAGITGEFSAIFSIASDFRWGCFYVDWDESANQWSVELSATKGSLQKALAGFKESIEADESHPKNC